MPISNTPRAYAWGSSTLIAELQGRAPSGAPEAEIWYGDHPGSPSRVDDGSGRTLETALTDAGVPPLPYLLKLLAAGTSLSIQAHPSKAQAAAGFAREEAAGIARDADTRTYRDDNHKPEIIVALSPTFRALVGLRPLSRTRALLRGLGDRPGLARIGEMLAHPGDEASADAAAEASGSGEAAALRRTIEWALTGDSADAVADLAAALAEPAQPGSGESAFAAEREVLHRIAEEFPADAGLIVALLMNLVVLRRGDALFAPAGALHAYQDGLGVELMAASDNVLRGGLTPKHIDAGELMSIVETTPGAAPVVEPSQEAPGVFSYDAGVADFRLVRAEVRPERAARVPLVGTAIVLATVGSVGVVADGERLTLAPGEGAVVTSASVLLDGDGEAFVAQPGVA